MSAEIPSRFCGPTGWANGGYSCGTFAALAGEPRRATVTLRKPIALETGFDDRAENGRTAIEDPRGELVAEVVASASLELEPPERPDAARAAEASAASPFRTERHPYPHCFVCGPLNAAGLHVHPGSLDADGRAAAAPVEMPAGLLEPDGSIPLPVVWALLDCPTYVPAFWDEKALLGRLSADVPGPVDGREPLVAVGWALGREGRKMGSAAALLDSSGEVLASSEALWIAVAG